ncbi:MAG: DNA polymerase III subunit delta [Candidatus Pelagibacter sp.]
MIIKSFETEKIKSKKNNLILLYGKNQGYKNQVINEIFEGETSRYEENEILSNYENFISNLMNKSLFDDEKLIIISRASEKILNFVNEIIERKIDKVRIIINSDSLEKKSKLRNLFEKENELICIPFYEDNEKSLNIITQNFFRKKNIKVSQEIINLLAGRARGDRGNLINELNKIEILSITKKNIKIEDILKLTNLSENYSVFELAENYLAKNKKQISKILNENNFVNEECILILRTILNRSKRLLKLKESQSQTGNIDLTLSSYKPPIFWKEKDIVKKQIQVWSDDEVKKMIRKLSDLEILIKKNSNNSLNFVSDFVSNY